ncbi:MAG: phenylalanine--tRNA ligase subunit alpha, partial [Verrucomicrobiota bacterium]
MNAKEIIALKESALAEAAAAKDAAGLEAVRIKYLSRKGQVPAIMDGLRNVPADERKDVGRLANELKTELQALLEKRRKDLEQAAVQHGKQAFDCTLPGRWRGLGSRHPISQIIERSISIFRSLGFTVADGPDIESEYHNFDALNTPADHPSRDTQDTFYLAA